MAVCARCAIANPESAKFCSECGASLGASSGQGRRKVVTVLF